MGLAVACCAVAAVVILFYGAPKIMGWFQSWTHYRCYGVMPGVDTSFVCEDMAEANPLALLVMFAAVTLVLFVPTVVVLALTVRARQR